MTRVAELLAPSQLLTAEPALDPAIADAYRTRLTGTFPSDLPRLLDAYVQAAAQANPAAAQANPAAALQTARSRVRASRTGPALPR